MAKITDYPKIQDLENNNVFLTDGNNGTKGILATDLGKALLSLLTTKEIMENVSLENLDEAGSLVETDTLLIGTISGNKKLTLSRDAVYNLLDPVIPIETRRNLWRGKNLGAAVTDDQYNQINAGTFIGLFLGDYWVIGGRIWRIVDFDYWLGTGDTECVTHHLVIMPDALLYNAKMNDTNITTGGYIGSKMYKTNLTQAKTIINGAFTANHILNHREYFINAVTNGYPSGGAWVDSTIDLPNEIMMYGSYIFAPGSTGSIVPLRITINKSQLAGMKASPHLISPNRENIWLLDVVSGTIFAYVDYYGAADFSGASDALGVRPVFGLKK